MDPEYGGNPKNPGSTMEFLGVRWESWEYNENPKNPESTQSAVSPLRKGDTKKIKEFVVLWSDERSNI
jgi:hypothetical protein